MSNNLIVSLDDLRILSKNMETDRKKVDNLYNNRIKDLVLQSEECLKSHGITKEKELENFSELLKKYDDSINDLVNVLNTKIIPNYEELKSDLSELFNKDFFLKIESLLNSDK